MFFIADIEGVTTPYEVEAFRRRRDIQRVSTLETDFSSRLERAEQDLETEQLQENALAEDALHSDTLENDAVVLEGSMSGERSGQGLDGASSQTIGLAGAGALQSARDLERSVESQESAKLREPAQRKPAGAIQAARSIALDDHVPTPDSKNRRGSFGSGSTEQRKEPPSITAARIMHEEPLSLLTSDPLDKAGELFRVESMRYLPVVSEEGKLVGILSDRDFLRATAQDSERDAGGKQPKRIADAMVRNVLSAAPEARLHDIAEVLLRERIGAMPVIDRDGQMLGMITRDDILKAIVDHAPSDIWES